MRHSSVGGDAVLEAEELPTCISYLDATLSNVKIDYFAHSLLMIMNSSEVFRVFIRINNNYKLRINSLMYYYKRIGI
jgi:hypothetical protein